VTITEVWSESELLYDWWLTANHFVLSTSPLRPTTRIFILQLNPCGYSPYVTSCLTRGWVCRLQLLLVLASAVRVPRTHDTLLSQIRDPPPQSGGPRPPGIGWPTYSPRHWGPFSSSATPRRATVEVFDPASTRSLDWYCSAHNTSTRPSSVAAQLSLSGGMAYSTVACAAIGTNRG
jgi:hypothetical protein